MGELGAPWGRIPLPVVRLAQRLSEKAAKDAARLTRIEWPTEPTDIQDVLRRTISDAHKVAQAGTDLRSMLSAYAHRFHKPRPLLSDLARAQNASPQGFTRRYSESTVAALEQLLSTAPELDPILEGFPSLSLDDLVAIGGAVGEAAARERKRSLDEIGS